MRYVRLLSIAACLATLGLIGQAEVSSVMAGDGPDIGIVKSEVCPADKGDTLVVYSATWCGPCRLMAPHWTLLRSQGYKVVYIDVDNPHKYDGKYDYVTAELVDKCVANKSTRSVPEIRYYNSDTDKFVGVRWVGITSLTKIKTDLWKPSSSKGLVPELRR